MLIMFKNQCIIKYISNPGKVLRRRTKERECAKLLQVKVSLKS